MDRIGERIEADGFDALTAPERYYWAIERLTREAFNGAFYQYFFNDYGEMAYDALQGLKAVGAHQLAAILQAAVDLFPNGEVPMNRKKRNRVLSAFTPQQEERLDQLTDAFTEYPDDLPVLMDIYVKEHDTYLLGPKTLLELWHARRARGAETRPHSTFNVDLDKEAERDAKVTDRQCPICAQPAPDYRRTCKRCGYPYGDY